MTTATLKSAVGMISVYSCKVCLDYTTKSWYAIDRHVMEQHSGFGYRCQECHKVFSRSNQKHQRCSMGEKAVDMPVFNRLTGSLGKNAEKDYEEAKKYIPDKIMLVKKSFPSGTQSQKRKHVEAEASNFSSNSKVVCGPKKVLECEESEVQKVHKKQKSLHLSLKEFTHMEPPISPLPAANDEETVSEGEAGVVSDGDLSTNIMEEPVLCDVSEKDVLSLYADDDHEVASNRPRPSTPEKEKDICQPLISGYDAHSKIVDAIQHQQDERILLNIGGQKFECSRVSLHTDPSSLLAIITSKVSGVRPVKEGGLPSYFIDRDPLHFRHVLNYLRNSGTIIMSTLPKERRFLEELKREAEFYWLKDLGTLVEKRKSQLSEE